MVVRCRIGVLGLLSLVVVATTAQAETGLYSRFYLRYQIFNEADNERVYQQLEYLGPNWSGGSGEVVYDDLHSLFLVAGADLTFKFDSWKWFAGWERSGFDIDYHLEGDAYEAEAYFDVSNLYMGVGFERRPFEGPLWFSVAAQYNLPAVEETFNEFAADESEYWSVTISFNLAGSSTPGSWSTYLASTQGKRLGGGSFPRADGVEAGVEVPWRLGD